MIGEGVCKNCQSLFDSDATPTSPYCSNECKFEGEEKDKIVHAQSRLRAEVEQIFTDVVVERLRQRAMHPTSERLPDGTGGAGRPTYETIARNACQRADREGRLTHAHVFEEEAAEVLAETDPKFLREELVQVMAVCAKWIADLDSRDPPVEQCGDCGEVIVGAHGHCPAGDLEP